MICVTLALMALAQIRRLLPFLSVGIFSALVVDGWIFYSRWARDRETERVRVEKEAQQARRTLDLMGGTELKILNWYVSPPTIRRGAEANLCYSVVGAKIVRMEPAVKELYPAFSHCIQVSPRSNTEYKLFAEDNAGHTVTANSTLTVIP
jgi:hypothetical protein